MNLISIIVITSLVILVISVLYYATIHVSLYASSDHDCGCAAQYRACLITEKPGCYEQWQRCHAEWQELTK